MIARRLIVILGALAAAVTMRLWPGSLPWVLWVPTGLLAASAALQFHRGLGSQLLVRAVWWSNLLLGALIAASGHSDERRIAAVLALGTGAALLALGRRGLDDAPGAFVPVAFRTSLMAILIMAMADAQSLALFGALRLEDRVHGRLLAFAPLACALVIAVALVGIYRLRMWGVILNLVANLAIAALSLMRMFDLPRPLMLAYVVTAGLQVLLTAPLLVAVARGRAAPSPPKLPAGRYALSAAIVGALVAFSVVFGLFLDIRVWRM